MNIVKEKVLKSINVLASKEIDNTLKGRCLFLCYQPKIPESLKSKKVK